MILEISSQDFTGYPVTVNNGIVLNKSGVSIVVKPQVLNGDLVLNIISAKFSGLSLFGAVRNKANSIILSMLQQYKINSAKINGNIVVNHPNIKFDNCAVNFDNIQFNCTIIA